MRHTTESLLLVGTFGAPAGFGCALGGGGGGGVGLASLAGFAAALKGAFALEEAVWLLSMLMSYASSIGSVVPGCAPSVFFWWL